MAFQLSKYVVIYLLLAVNGLNASRQFVANETIQAEDFSSATEFSVFSDCADSNLVYLGEFTTTSVLKYAQVDFASGVNVAVLRVANMYDFASLDVSLHVGSPTSAPIATYAVAHTGNDKCDFINVKVNLSPNPSGVQDLFITFPTQYQGELHLDWFTFETIGNDVTNTSFNVVNE